MSNELRSPSLQEILTEDIPTFTKLGLHTCLPGRVVSFNTQTGKAAIQPEVKSKLNGKFVSLPQINNVPIMFFRAGGFRITMPVKKDDKVLIMFTERSIDGWLEDGQDAGPRATHTHNLSDAIAIPGVYPFSDVPPFDGNDVVIGKEDGSVEVRLKPSGEAVIKGSSVKLGSDAASESVVLGDKQKTQLDFDFNAMKTLQTAIKAWVPLLGDGGTALKTILAAFLVLPLGSTANTVSSKVKTE